MFRFDYTNPLWFVLCFAGLWCGISAAMSLLSGWWSLASRFRAAGPVQGERLRFVSGALGAGPLPVSYGRCLFVTIAEQGLYLDVLFLLRVLSPPLFIPWASMESVEEQRMLFRRATAIRIRNHWAGLAFYGEAGRRIREAHARYSR